MGCASNVGYNKFPKQGTFLGKKTKVCFFYETDYLKGVVVRDDAEAPFLTIIRLDDGRYIMSTECQYAPEP